MPEAARPDTGWHMDKRVPIALILAILVQTGSVFWWASAISQRVAALEAERVNTADQPGRIIRLETQIGAIQASIASIDAKLDRLLQIRYENGPDAP